MALARPISATRAKDYYYEIDPISAPEGKGENSSWYGQALQEEFQLSGRVNADAFSLLVTGQDPRDTKEIVPVGVNQERRAGIDLAFSAPKSVSIAALHLVDDRIIEAHKNAVAKALEYIEENLIQYREWDKASKTLHKVQSDNMLASTFLHTTSRANEPLENKLIIVDEVSMVSSKDMLELLKRASDGNNRIALIGDRKQLQAMGAGKMFSELQNTSTVRTTVM